MRLASLTTREQVLVFVTAAILVGGVYGLLRYRPALKALGELQAQIRSTEERVKTTKIPDAPEEDPVDLKRRADLADAELKAAQEKLAALQSRLASEDQRQELKLRMSELAQASGLVIRGNEAYVPATLAQTSTMIPSSGGFKRKKARQPAQTVPTSPQTPIATVGNGLEMPTRFAQMGMQRLLQQVVLEGTYHDIRFFLNELRKLPWQVTVAQLRLEVVPLAAPPGAPQPLRATLVLAL